MKIKLSKAQWEAVGFKAGWIKKAGCDQYVNPEYTNNVAEELLKIGDTILSKSSHEIEVSHKIMGNKTIVLKIQVFQEEYGGYSSMVYAGDRIIGMPGGETPEELIENLNIVLRMILDEINQQQFLKDI